MDLTKIKIVSDSSSDITDLSPVRFASAPLKIITDEKEYVDDPALNIQTMVEELQEYHGRSHTSCPSVGDWLDAFGDAQWVFCVTITGTLSGSYGSAMSAKTEYEEMYPERRVFVLNSLTAGPEMALILEKIRDLVMTDLDFDSICQALSDYRQKTGTVFMLESMQNLVNNGRVSPLVAKMAGLLGLRVVGKASDRGDLEPLGKHRGEKKALEAILDHLRSHGLKKGKVRIAHCFNDTVGSLLKERIQQMFSGVEVRLYRCRGLCSFYAEKGGLLVGFEKA